ncbi:MAG TPA: aminotransferase class I/II-fold pyridoxal phosphate-dependent enzyme, partial [Dehalococcoidia bacterium]
MTRREKIPVAEPIIGDLELEYVSDAVRSGWVSSLGEYITRFEDGIAGICGARHAVAVSNGTSALHLALVALGVGPGDEVIVPALTFIATANAVRYTGATPVFCDSDDETWCIDVSDIERRITSRTKAIVPVHLFGHPADVYLITGLARARGIAIIEDAAEALGTRYRGLPVGALGDAGIFSFYGNKLITTGEGGMLVTDDDAIAERARHLRDHAMHAERRYFHDEVGFNFRMTNIQAALGVAQIERFPHLLARKREIARRYGEAFRGTPGISMQHEATWAGSSWWMTTIRIAGDAGISRDELAAHLAANGIDTRPVFLPLHTLPPYASGESLPVAERARHLRDHAMHAERRYFHDEVGFNFRMTNIQAA